MEAIRLVGEHMSGKTTLTPLQLSGGKNWTLSDINFMLRRRQAAMKLKPSDTNAATHLIRQKNIDSQMHDQASSPRKTFNFNG